MIDNRPFIPPCRDRNHANPTQVESKQMVLESSKRDLEEEKGLLERGRRDAAEEADKLDERRGVSERGFSALVCTRVWWV